MPSISTSAFKYTGDLLAVDLLSDSQTVLLSAIEDGPTAGELADNEGTLRAKDSGISTFQGNALTYIGSGTVTPGAEVGGIIVPVGDPVDVVVFEMGGDIYFHYPDGDPNLLSAVALVVDIDESPYEVFPNPYIGTPGADDFTGDYFSNIMTGADSDDIISGRAGFDNIKGGDGADSLHGGMHNDIVRGGSGNDSITGDHGSDLLGGGTGSDTILGGSGYDEIYGGGGSDWIDAGLGNDSVNGGTGNDIIFGNRGSDAINGGRGADDISGNGGNDRINGNAHNDIIDGGWGHDSLNGGLGDDTLTGNKGADVFVFNESFGNDVVTDFRHDADRLDFSGNSQINSFTQFSAAAVQQGSDVFVDTGNGTLLLENTSLSELDAGDFIFG